MKEIMITSLRAAGRAGQRAQNVRARLLIDILRPEGSMICLAKIVASDAHFADIIRYPEIIISNVTR